MEDHEFFLYDKFPSAVHNMDLWLQPVHRNSLFDCHVHVDGGFWEECICTMSWVVILVILSYLFVIANLLYNWLLLYMIK